ncbi:MAG TPA: hypothetical protein VIY49_18545 [Bryobacteraceae bacterium]
MSQLVYLLDQDHPVIDKTNLKGYYQFSIVRLAPVAASEAGQQPRFRGNPRVMVWQKPGSGSCRRQHRSTLS